MANCEASDAEAMSYASVVMGHHMSRTNVTNPAPGSATGVATVRGYRRTGHAIVTVTRNGHSRRYRVSLKRWHALRDKLNVGLPWRCYGAWLHSSMDVTVGPGTWAEWHAR
jgi:hypothetical protein